MDPVGEYEGSYTGEGGRGVVVVRDGVKYIQYKYGVERSMQWEIDVDGRVDKTVPIIGHSYSAIRQFMKSLLFLGIDI